MATSVGGVLTGRGADLIIIDDPLKPDEAMSESRRNAVNEWYDHTLLTRLNDKERGCIVIIMQQLHQDDLVGHVVEQEDWGFRERRGAVARPGALALRVHQRIDQFPRARHDDQVDSTTQALDHVRARWSGHIHPDVLERSRRPRFRSPYRLY
jgi:hypothetical protein